VGWHAGVRSGHLPSGSCSKGRTQPKLRTGRTPERGSCPAALGRAARSARSLPAGTRMESSPCPAAARRARDPPAGARAAGRRRLQAYPSAIARRTPPQRRTQDGCHTSIVIQVRPHSVMTQHGLLAASYAQLLTNAGSRGARIDAARSPITAPALADCRSRPGACWRVPGRSRPGPASTDTTSARRVREQVIAVRLPSVGAGRLPPVSSGPGGCRPAGSRRCAGQPQSSAKHRDVASGSSSARAAEQQRQMIAGVVRRLLPRGVCCCPSLRARSSCAPIATTSSIGAHEDHGTVSARREPVGRHRGSGDCGMTPKTRRTRRMRTPATRRSRAQPGTRAAIPAGDGPRQRPGPRPREP